MVVFLVDTLAHQFAVSKAAIIWTITATLAMRPVGALLFGLLADRFGRRQAANRERHLFFGDGAPVGLR
ncbi:MAG: hypothetical protein ACR2JB_30240 [Bryobacteraceae bacterium]